MRKRMLNIVMLIMVLGISAYAAGPTFRPDFIFKGSALTGWTPIGAADWKAQNGEIVGTPKSPAGGWLVLNKSFEDVGVFSNITCDADCKAGILMRAEKTPGGGMKGLLLQVENGELKSFAVTIDAQGNETAREALPAGGGRGVGGGGGRGAGGGRGGGQAGATTGVAPPAGRAAEPVTLPPGVSLPALGRRSGAYVPGQPNAVDVNLTYNGYAVKLNGAAAAGAGGQLT